MNNISYDSLTPMMKQYYDIKIENMDSILMFRLGDFYEMFFDDAEVASKELDIVLTARSSKDKNKIPMCGIPYHSADNYISRLINKGYKVAICEQLQDPDEADGIVERGIVRVITPGTNLQIAENDSSNNYLASVFAGDSNIGFCYVDFSTGDLFITSIQEDYNDQSSVIRNQLSILEISELIINDGDLDIRDITEKNSILVNTAKDKDTPGYDGFINDLEYVGITAEQITGNYYLNQSLKNLYTYLQDTQFGATDHIRKISYINIDEFMVLDRHTLYSLDIFSESGNKEEGTLFHLLDRTQTAMGSRLLRYFLEHPLKDKNLISLRLSIVEKFLTNLSRLDQLRRSLYSIYDLERIMVKISGVSNSPKDLIQLKNSLVEIPGIIEILNKYGISTVEGKNISEVSDLSDVYSLIENSIMDNPPVSYRDGGIIKPGYSEELDNLKDTTVNSKTWISSYENKLREDTGINNLRIKFNKVLGYFVEVTKSNVDKVPEYFIRKQTLVGSERYFTEELKDAEVQITSSDDKINNLETSVYKDIRDIILDKYDEIISLSELISYVDVFSTFSHIAFENNYIKPDIAEDNNLSIEGGRHPIVELNQEEFISNNSSITDEVNFILLTGPNMAGKSTYMRQVAIISIMMQIGSFVPASSASIPVFDRVFTRIGAHDDLYMGESTFMVEMKEMADIIDNATSDSLIILDEIGRGTSTFDGLSLAKALIVYIIENIDAKTIFATHFHELTELEDSYSNIKNQTMKIKDDGGDIQFLRKVIDGTTDKSYGIHVATLAGIKDEIVFEANKYLREYEMTESKGQIGMFSTVQEDESMYRDKLKDLQSKQDELIEYINNIDINNITPIESMTKLSNLKDLIKDE